MFSDIPSNKFYSFNQQTEKPVGGLATFMREDKRKNKSKYPVHLPSQKNEFRNEGKKEKQIKAQRTN